MGVAPQETTASTYCDQHGERIMISSVLDFTRAFKVVKRPAEAPTVIIMLSKEEGLCFSLSTLFIYVSLSERKPFESEYEASRICLKERKYSENTSLL
jgi:hypothetical protein